MIDFFVIFDVFFNNYKIASDNMQNTISEIASTIVVINGLATTAGSSLHFFARSGRQQPTIFAMQIVQKSAIETTKEMIML